jgi:branched-chain amino acid transport system permease protein
VARLSAILKPDPQNKNDTDSRSPAANAHRPANRRTRSSLLPGEAGLGTYAGTLLGFLAGLAAAYVTYLMVVRPIQRSAAIPREEKEIFVLTGTLLWGIMIQQGMAYLFTDNPVTMRPLIGGVRTPLNEVMIAVICWVVIGMLWMFVNRTRAGHALLAASINPRGLSLLGFELSRVYFLAWPP